MYMIKTKKHTHTPKKAKNLRRFLGFPNYVKRFLPNYSTLKYTHRPLERPLTKGVDFDLTGTCNEIYIDSTVYRHQPIWDILAILKKKKKKKQKTVAIKLYPIIHERCPRQIDDVS